MKLFASSFLIGIILSFGSTTFQFSLASASLEKREIGKIASVTGKAWISQASNPQSKVPIKLGASLEQGDTLFTESEAQLKIVVGAKEAALLLKNDSQLRITQSPTKDWMIELDHGMLLSSVKPEAAAKRNHFQVKTRSAVIGVHGTVFFIKAEKDRDVFLCTCSGIVTIDNKALIMGKNHDSPKWIQAGTQPIAKRLMSAKMGDDHTNEEAAALNDLIKN